MSTDEYVPSEEDMEEFYTLGRVEYSPGSPITLSGAHDEFRAWLAAHDARVRRDAEAAVLREAAEYMNDDQDAQYLVDCARDTEEADR